MTEGIVNIVIISSYSFHSPLLFCFSKTGHAFGLPHTDEEYYNAERGDCLDYTVDPKKNMQPGKYNFDLLKQLYGESNRRILRYLKKKRKKKKRENGDSDSRILSTARLYRKCRERSRRRDGSFS